MFADFRKSSTFASQSREIANKKINGALVQLVRIHACHAWGHGFESRTHREERNTKVFLSFFCFIPRIFFLILHLLTIGLRYIEAAEVLRIKVNSSGRA